jgi:hypothetical protein
MAYVGNNLTVQQYAPQIAYFNGNGSTVAFTLPVAVVSAAQIIVAIENVIQNPSSSYSVSGTTLTFTSAPPSGTNNIWVEYTSLQTNTVVPSAGTVGQAQMSSPTGTGFPVLQTSPTLITPTLTTPTLTTPTLTSPTMTGAVVSSMASSVITSATAVAASGTSVDFTGIPSWAKRITVTLANIVSNSNNVWIVQVGAGSITTSGYGSGSTYSVNNSIATTNLSTGLLVNISSSNNAPWSGQLILSLQGSNKWVSSSTISQDASARVCWASGSIALGGALDRVRFTTGGAESFTAGTINILYE